MTGRHFWAMTTTPGPDRLAYANSTRAQLAAQGIGPDVLHVMSDENYFGQAWNFRRALVAGLASDAEKITLFEDDIEICRGFVDRVKRQPIPADCAFISWFDPFLGCPRLGDYYHPTVPPKEPFPASPRMVRRVCALFYCNQALTFRRETAAKIAHDLISQIWNRPHEGDTMVGQIMKHADYGVHFPSLVQHVGAVSLCNPGAELKKNRISHHYQGKDFDAGTLEIFT